MTRIKILWIAIAILQTITFVYKVMLVGLINEHDDYVLLGGFAELVLIVIFTVLALLTCVTRRYLPRLQWWALGVTTLTVIILVYVMIVPPVVRPPLNNLLFITGVEFAKMIVLLWFVLRSKIL